LRGAGDLGEAASEVGRGGDGHRAGVGPLDLGESEALKVGEVGEAGRASKFGRARAGHLRGGGGAGAWTGGGSDARRGGDEHRTGDPALVSASGNGRAGDAKGERASDGGEETALAEEREEGWFRCDIGHDEHFRGIGSEAHNDSLKFVTESQRFRPANINAILRCHRARSRDYAHPRPKFESGRFTNPVVLSVLCGMGRWPHNPATLLPVGDGACDSTRPQNISITFRLLVWE
jgi:hypothetical protein